MGCQAGAPEEAAFERDTAQVRAALDEVGFAAAWAEGRSLTGAEGIEYALGKNRSAFSPT